MFSTEAVTVISGSTTQSSESSDKIFADKIFGFSLFEKVNVFIMWGIWSNRTTQIVPTVASEVYANIRETAYQRKNACTLFF